MPSLTGAGKGASTGAAIGSIVPGVGTLIGGGLGALFGGLFGHGKKATDPTASAAAATPTASSSTDLMNDPSIKALMTQGQKIGAKGDALSGMGSDALAPVLDYFKKIMSGGSDALAATAPERGRVIDQYDTARNSIARFAPRGGGSAQAFGDTYTKEAQGLGDVAVNAKNTAVAGAQNLGTTLTGLGLSADQLENADLSTVLNAIMTGKGLDLNAQLTREGFDITKRGQNAQTSASIAEGLSTLLGLFLTKKKEAA